jgi:hypothetical protein
MQFRGYIAVMLLTQECQVSTSIFLLVLHSSSKHDFTSLMQPVNLTQMEVNSCNGYMFSVCITR